MARKTDLTRWRRLVDEVEVLRNQGMQSAPACRQVGIQDGMYYQWKKFFYGKTTKRRYGKFPGKKLM